MSTNVPRVILKPRRAQPFFGRHPWLFSGAIARTEGHPQPGDEVAVVSHEHEFIAYGLWNPISNIQGRLYSWDETVRLDEPFWSRQLDTAFSLRRELLQWDGPGTACRLVFSEADGLSGLILDRYDRWLLVQFTSFALAQRQELLLRLLREKLQPAGIWLRTEKGIREAEGLSIQDGLLWGETPPRPILVEEHGLKYRVDVVEGQKTGFFLDQRDNRAAIVPFMRGRRVLDICCYSGGFTWNALARGGATSAMCVDISASAVTLAQANAELNGLADRVQFEKGDAFKTLENLAARGERFGAVVLDPPKLTRHGKGLPEALRGYFSLNRLAFDVLEPGGILVTCSCTGHVSRSDFESMLADVARSSGRPLQILASRGPAADHPTSVYCPETDYLKCYICRVL